VPYALKSGHWQFKKLQVSDVYVADSWMTGTATGSVCITMHCMMRAQSSQQLCMLSTSTYYVLQDVLAQLMTDRSISASSKISAHTTLSSLPDDKRHQLLAARGLLACGLLTHCLQSRHRVNYGINRCG